MSTRVLSLNPAFHSQLLATCYWNDDGLFYPALVGLFGPVRLLYIVPSGFPTSDEACNVAVASKQVAGTPLHLIEERVA